MRSKEIEAVARNVFSFKAPEDKIFTKYDRDADVLYLNFLESDPKKADFGRRFGDYIVRFKNKVVIGFTISNAKYHFKVGFRDGPSIFWHIL